MIRLIRRRAIRHRTRIACVVAIAGLAVAGLTTACGPTHPPPPVLGSVPAFSLVDQNARAVTADDLLGQPWVADFVFTRCTLICPAMTERMMTLERSHRDRAVRFVSVSVDPEHDTPEVLKAYAERVRAGSAWLFLTGTREAIRALSVDGMKLAMSASEDADVPPGEAIVHSNRFVLVDAENQIRGYYDAFDRESLDRLRADLDTLIDD